MASRYCAMSEKTLELHLPQHFESEARQGLTTELEQRLWRTQVLQQAQRQLNEAAVDDDPGFDMRVGRWQLSLQLRSADEVWVKVHLQW